ncbi:EcsC family protein [Bacillus sp. V3B]|uniref:EcsC family protein n=1 Tax=Bacillus sp. V3B TaxID=2804915 RepID=UPI002108706D|nr:EcsC family protein [Bacillus sp. V3B]MCQ6274391.1 EcsC family protein [Bacillus sp. V3B]
MTLTDREKKIFHEISEWENKIYAYESNDFQLVYDKYIEHSFQLLPLKKRQQFLSSLDNWLFHLHALIQGSELQIDAKERILASGRIFQDDIQTIEEMGSLTIDQLQYIAEQQIARHRLYSFAQGGMSGTGGTILLGADIPGMAVINLRVVQLIAMTYGIEVNTPYEMMTSLKVFNASTLPLRLQSQGWEELMNDLQHTSERYFYEGNEDLANTVWIDQLLKQGLKGLAIVIFRKKLIQGIPFISMAIGAGANYQLTRKVTDFAHKYYQMRFLLQKKGELE